MRRFNGETLESLLNRLNLPDDVPIEAKMVNRAIEARRPRSAAELRVRKNVFKYDEVMNQQRKVIYEERHRILEGENLQQQAHDMLVDVVDGVRRRCDRARAMRRTGIWRSCGRRWGRCIRSASTTTTSSTRARSVSRAS